MLLAHVHSSSAEMSLLKPKLLHFVKDTDETATLCKMEGWRQLLYIFAVLLINEGVIEDSVPKPEILTQSSLSITSNALREQRSKRQLHASPSFAGLNLGVG